MALRVPAVVLSVIAVAFSLELLSGQTRAQRPTSELEGLRAFKILRTKMRSPSRLTPAHWRIRC